MSARASETILPRLHSMFRLSLAIVLSILAVCNSGTTGKISGTVKDAVGIPIPGAAVTIDATRLGTTTDADGRYMIFQVPPGNVSVTVYMIGYNTTRVTGIHMSADLTSNVDFRLAEETIVVDAIIVTAERPPIEIDVTSSRTVVDADRVSELPVNQMLDVLNYQPGVNVERGNELEIRGGGPSEIRFQVDGLDRTDGLTAKSYTQLNQVLVAEVALLTGGFNAEYGNVRSGMVNVVVKEGNERGNLRPWVAGVFNYAPSQRKNFGPGAYDEDQHDYWLVTQSDSAKTGRAVYWPDLYPETINADSLQALVTKYPGRYLAFGGWAVRAQRLNAKRLGSNASYNHTAWEIDDIIEAWQYEANMNEVAWRYGNNPDAGMDLAIGMRHCGDPTLSKIRRISTGLPTTVS
jgi:hypothetical protein